jgi:carboxyl-terminal processing protease
MSKHKLNLLRKWILTFVLIFLSGYAGFLFGEQRLKLSYKNWKQPVSFDRVQILDQAKERKGDFSQFWIVWDKLSEQYVDKTMLDSDKLIRGAISGMVAAVGDPYTVYLPPTQNKESKEDLGGAFEGVGIQLGFKEKQLAVVAALPDTPSFKAGVKSGDLIIKIQDEAKKINKTTAGMTLPEAVSIIRGTKGSKVTITIVREDSPEPKEYTLTRDTIVVKSVSLTYREKNGQQVPIIQLNRFGDRTQDEWNEIINQLSGASNDQYPGIVLDLRNNPGGYLEGAVYLAGEFLPAGKLVVTQQYGDGSKVEHKVTRNGRFLKEKLVVLVNGGSASAAEILSGAIQDYKRAKVVGEKTFGKGSVQQPEDFPDGSGIHITVAKWLLPSGNWVDKNGINPDIVIEPEENPTDETRDIQLEKAIEVL